MVDCLHAVIAAWLSALDKLSEQVGHVQQRDRLVPHIRGRQSASLHLTSCPTRASSVAGPAIIGVAACSSSNSVQPAVLPVERS